MKNHPPKIALLHHAGGGNLGDDAIIDSVVANIRSRYPQAFIAAFSMNPEDTQKRHGIAAYPIRSFRWSMGYAAAAPQARSSNPLLAAGGKLLRKVQRTAREVAFWSRSFGRLRQFDTLVVSGGGQLTERSGPWGFPYALFVWSWMAKLAGVRLLYLNIGAGPLRHPLSCFFVRRSLAAASYVSFRDQPSKDLAAHVGYRGPGQVCPDNVYGASFAIPAPPQKSPGSLLVGIAPMSYPYCDPREHPSADLQRIYEDFLGKLGAFATGVSRQGFGVQLFGSDMGTDPEAIRDLEGLLTERYQLTPPSGAPVHSLEDLLGVISAMDIVVTCRYHGVVLAHLLNKPVLAIAHHPKVTALMEALGLSEYCVDIQDFSPERLEQLFASLVENREQVKVRMREVLADFRQQIAAQFDSLFCSPAASLLMPAGMSAAGSPSAENVPQG